MNITSDKHLISILVVLLVLSSFTLEAQSKILTNANSNFKIGVEFGGGYGFKLRSTNKLEGDYSSSGMNYTLRLKWGLGNIFGAGIETGYIAISSLKSTSQVTPLGVTDISASLNAIPALFIVTAQYANLQLFTGLGYYNVMSTSTVFNSTIESSEWDFGYLVSLGYAYPINSTYKIGAEIRVNNISEVQITNLSAQLKLMVKLFEW
ncbi:MAG: outer membrane beta-barrel protein [Melioribacteraceae bacterium]